MPSGASTVSHSSAQCSIMLSAQTVIFECLKRTSCILQCIVVLFVPAHGALGSKRADEFSPLSLSLILSNSHSNIRDSHSILKPHRKRCVLREDLQTIGEIRSAFGLLSIQTA